ncbi:MAG: hypothetical protein EA426_18510 [Spirochaetaceae bacterium]|nr:MAG: hypothetical protein EA426_18510 [Spirochaetaceae bacterium]
MIALFCRFRPAWLTALALALFLLAAPLTAFDDIDDLFSDPDAGIIEEDDSEDPDETVERPRVDIGALTTSAPRFSGKVELEGALAYGLTEWPGTEAAGGASAADLLDGSVYYLMSSRFTIDARPRSYLRYYVALSTAMDTKKFTFPSPSVAEIFVDYTLADFLYFRIGRQSMTWGQGRLLGNPANLVSRLSGGVGVKGFMPLGPNGLTAVIYGKPEFFADAGNPSYKEFGYAALFDTTVGPFSLGLSAHYQRNEPLALAAYAKTAIAGFDVTTEAVVRRTVNDDAPAADPDYKIIANLFREFGSPAWQVIGEYLFDATVPDYAGHRIALGLLAPRFAHGWRPGVRFYHAFEDNSGQIVLGADATVAPSLKLSLGVPITYGAPGSFYREENEDPGDRVASAIVRLGLSFSF